MNIKKINHFNHASASITTIRSTEQGGETAL